MEVVDLISHFSYTFIKGLLNKNCPHTNTLKLWFYNFAKTSINFFAKLTLTISQELSRIDEDFLCAIARIWQWRHPAVLAVCRLYPTYKVTKNLGQTRCTYHRCRRLCTYWFFLSWLNEAIFLFHDFCYTVSYILKICWSNSFSFSPLH